MGRLIWAELKKILLSKKAIIGITITLILFIGLMTYTYYESNRYAFIHNNINNQSINNQNRSNQYTEQNGADVIPNLISTINNIKDNLQNKITELENIKGKNIKEIINSNYDYLLNFDALYENVYNQNIVNKVNNYDGINYNLLENLFEDDGELKLYIDNYSFLLEELNTKVNNIEYFENYILFKKDNDYSSNRYYYKNEIFMNYQNIKYQFNFWVELDDEYQYPNNNFSETYVTLKQAYNALEEGQDTTELEDNSVSFLNGIFNYFTYYDNLFPVDYINNYKSFIDEALGFTITEDIYNYLNNFIIDQSKSVFNRLYGYIEELEEFQNIESLTSLNSYNIEIIMQRTNYMENSINNYMNYYVIYNNFENLSDSVLKNYDSDYMKTKYNMKKYITTTEYIINNDLHFKDIGYSYSNDLTPDNYLTAGSSLSLGSLFTGMLMNYGNINMYSYISFVFNFLSLVIITICIVLGGGAIAGEQSKGTIKMLMIRPYKRWKILTAKILSTLIVSLVLITISYLILMLLGAVLFGFNLKAYPVFCVFNASKVVILNQFTEILLKLLMMFISLIIYTIIATLFSAVLKSKTAAVCVALLLNIIGTIFGIALGNLQVFKYFIFSNSDLFMYYSSGPLYNDMTFLFSFIVCFVYVSIIGGITYWLFCKKDLN